MGLRKHIEIRLYKLAKPLSQEPSERRQLPSGDEPGREISRPLRGAVSILRGKTAAVVLTAALAGGGGVMLGGYVEDRGSDAQLAAAHDARMDDWRDSAEWRGDHDVCLARAEARAEPEDGVFAVMSDPRLDKCYAEQAAKVAEIHADAEGRAK